MSDPIIAEYRRAIDRVAHDSDAALDLAIGLTQYLELYAPGGRRGPTCDFDPGSGRCGARATARWTDGATDEDHYTCATHEEQAEPYYQRQEI